MSNTFTLEKFNIKKNFGSLGIIIIVVENETGDPRSISGQGSFIYANAIEKGLNSSLLLPPMCFIIYPWWDNQARRDIYIHFRNVDTNIFANVVRLLYF